jgi:hypothetical protein
MNGRTGLGALLALALQGRQPVIGMAQATGGTGRSFPSGMLIPPSLTLPGVIRLVLKPPCRASALAAAWVEREKPGP